MFSTKESLQTEQKNYLRNIPSGAPLLINHYKY